MRTSLGNLALGTVRQDLSALGQRPQGLKGRQFESPIGKFELYRLR
jgi:hypothetical protein